MLGRTTSHKNDAEAQPVVVVRLFVVTNCQQLAVNGSLASVGQSRICRSLLLKGPKAYFDTQAAAKARGTQLGNPRWRESIETARNAKGLVPPVPAVMDMLRDLRAEGLTLRTIADRLNALGLRTPKGSRWYASTVRGALKLYGTEAAA
jgi:hypothetical protein